MFIVPLLIIFGIVYWGVTSEQLVLLSPKEGILHQALHFSAFFRIGRDIDFELDISHKEELDSNPTQ